MMLFLPIKESTSGNDYYAPQWAPDGRKLSFIRADRANTTSKIEIASWREGLQPAHRSGRGSFTIEEVKVPDSSRSSYDYMFTWAFPAGEKYAFSSRPGRNAPMDIYINDGQAIRKITEGRGLKKHPDWNSDLLVFEDEWQLYSVKNPDAPNSMPKIWCNGVQAAISPDGNRIAYVDRLVGVDGWGVFISGENNPLFGRSGMDVRRPAWSPDGKKIAFYVRGTTSSKWAIYCVEVDTGQLLFPKETGRKPLSASLADNVALNEDFDFINPAWTPDSNKILFFANTPGYRPLSYINLEDGSAGEIDFDPSREYTLGMDVAVNPVGTEVAFVATKKMERGIYLIILNHF